MTRSVLLYIKDILEAARLIQEYTEAVRYEDFVTNVEKQNSVLRRIEIIGEATKRIPPSIQREYPHLPWREIAGTRDIIVHEYFRVDVDLVWDMVQKDIPELITTVERILRELPE